MPVPTYPKYGTRAGGVSCKLKEKREINLIDSCSELAGASSELDASDALSVFVASTKKPGPVNGLWSILCRDYGGC